MIFHIYLLCIFVFVRIKLINCCTQRFPKEYCFFAIYNDSSRQKLYSRSRLHIPWEKARCRRIWIWNKSTTDRKRFCKKFRLLFINIATVSKSSHHVSIFIPISLVIVILVDKLNVFFFSIAVKMDISLIKRPYCSISSQRKRNTLRNWRNLSVKSKWNRMKRPKPMLWKNTRNSWNSSIQKKILLHQHQVLFFIAYSVVNMTVKC